MARRDESVEATADWWYAQRGTVREVYVALIRAERRRAVRKVREARVRARTGYSGLITERELEAVETAILGPRRRGRERA